MSSVKKSDLDNPASRIAVTLTADRIFGKVLTLRECADILMHYHLDASVAILSCLQHLNEHVYLDTEIPRGKWGAAIRRFVDDFFDELLKPAVLREAQDNIDCFQPITHQALLATLELAVSVCPKDSGRQFDSIKERQSIAWIILSFQFNLLSADFQTNAQKKKSIHEITEKESAEFIRNFLAHNTSKYYRYSLARLYAICCVPEIGFTFTKRMQLAYTDWFEKLFGITPQTYFNLACLATFPAYRLNVEKPDARELYFIPEKLYGTVREPERGQLIELLHLATISAENFPPAPSLDLPIADFIYSCMRFYLNPILQIGTSSICVSPSLLMSKFIIGLPYLVIEIKKRSLGREPTLNEVKEIRSPLGYLFEGYVVFLLSQYLKNWNRTEIISPYYINGKPEERDVVVIRGDTAFVFELKSTVANLNLRKSGLFKDLDKIVADGVKQAQEAAEALISNNAKRENGKEITGIRRVVPCVITYDGVPLSVLNSSAYENHLETQFGKKNLSGKKRHISTPVF